ncbi:MAG: ATP-binding protein, partial [Thermodesulfobacteriota bacterium]|nr:ATP-binding protein [Thermodesulfobacteriota bacterium]
MIDKADRFSGVRQLIDDKRYFFLHAPRQTGKTTIMLQLMDELNSEGDYIALYVNVEAGQAWRNNIEQLNRTIVNEFRMNAKIYLPPEYRPSPACFADIGNEFSMFLINWCLELPKPLVLFMDEVDALIGDGLLSVLRQLRSGYTKRPRAFPHALCIIGLRDIRDYRIYSDEKMKYVVGGSAFNIKKESTRLEDFTLDHVKCLYAQHTEDTGQKFSSDAINSVFYFTNGQPWLVNALGWELCFGKFAIPFETSVQAADVDRSVEILIQRRDVHLDQLSDKLTEPRVARVIEAILVGEKRATEDITTEDRQYLIDLGLIRVGRQGLEIANPIYREVVPRELTLYDQDTIGQDPAWYIKEKGK